VIGTRRIKVAFVISSLFCGAAAMLTAGCDTAPLEPSSAEPLDEHVEEASDELNTAPYCVTYKRVASGTVADTYVSSFAPITNFGTSMTAFTQGTPSGLALFQFSLSGIPTDATITSAVVSLKESSYGGADTVSIRKITSSWNEGTVTWNTRPSVASTTAGSFTTSSSLASSFNVTSLAQQWVTTPSTNFGLQLEQASTFTEYKTSEAGTASDRPSLQACFTKPCAAGFGDCDAANGTCETNVQTSTANCGACGAVCGSAHTTSVACVSGACQLTCAAGYVNADGVASNGCERDLSIPGIINPTYTTCGTSSCTSASASFPAGDICGGSCANPATVTTCAAGWFYERCSSDGCFDGDQALAVYTPCNNLCPGPHVVCLDLW
jgi:hypothetical protein